MKKISLLLLLSLVWTGITPWISYSSHSEDFQAGSIRTHHVRTQDEAQLPALEQAALSSSEPAYEQRSSFLSQVYSSKFPFDAVALSWEESLPADTSLHVQIHFQNASGQWTNWQDVEADVDHKDHTVTESEGFELQEAFVNTSRSTALQYRVFLESVEGKKTPRFRSMAFEFIDASVGQKSAKPIQTPSLSKVTFGTGDLKVISRSEWGADETLRLASTFGPPEEEPEPEGEEDDNNESTLESQYPEEFAITKVIETNEKGEELYWPLEYAKNIKKVIVHHTATTENLNDPKAAIRAIYYYHSIRRGWGDIGYNYIIDPQGNIYEGRYGGERVVAGHALGYNTGTIGIAVLGNYQNSEVPYEVLEALSRLIGAKAELYDIQADGFGRFRGEVMPNVIGHRDAANTQCPGQKLYDLLPVLRKVTASNVANINKNDPDVISNEPFAFANVNDYEALLLEPDQAKTIEIQLKNTGQETWNNQTYLIANQNPVAESLVHFVKDSTNSKSLARLAQQAVKPGEVGTFTLNAQAYLAGGFQQLELTPIFNGSKKTRHYLNLPVYVSQPVLTYALKQIQVGQKRIQVGKPFSVTVKLQNSGNATWYREGLYPIQMGTASPQDRVSPFLSGVTNRYTSLKEEKVAPGQVGTFEFTLNAPKISGYYLEHMQPVIEGIGWLEGNGIQFAMTVYNGKSQALFKRTSDDSSFQPGEKTTVWVEVENVGELTWKKQGKNAFSVGKTHHSAIQVTSPKLKQSQVKPGETGRISFDITAPKTPGSYSVMLRPRVGKQHLTSKPFYFKFTVKGDVTEEPLDDKLIRIKLGYSQSQFGDPVISANGAFDVVLGSEKFISLNAGEQVKVNKKEDRYQLSYGTSAWVVENAPRFVPQSQNTIMEVVNFERRPSWDASINHNRFRGTLEVNLESEELILINELPLGHYMSGMAELPNDQPIEKTRTMAILARSYAGYYLLGKEEKFPGKPYHGSDDPNVFQKYLGYSYEIRVPNVVQAVKDTANKVVTYQGELVKTPYFTSSPGYTKSAEEVWGWTHTPYLIGVKDPCEGEAKGHQVGLSGCGAKILAEQGKTHEEIIKYFYTGVEIEAY